jgi:hypothetical protein
VVFDCVFRDGPCYGHPQKIEMGAHPDPSVTCGGQLYLFVASEGETVGGTFSGILVYGLAGGAIRGERDLFRAWADLHGALNSTTRNSLRLIRRSSHRIRRAVR